MDVSNRIYYDGAELLRATEQALDNLRTFQYAPRYRALLGDSLLDKLALWDKNIRERKDDPFTLVVCGEFKRGKSSLINALLGEDVVTTNVTTETVTLNRIRYGPRRNEAILSGGRRITLTDEELRKENLEELIRNLGESVTRLELSRPIELLKDVTIVDTPGLNDSLYNFSPLIEQALQQADAALYVCSVDMPLSQAEQLFLRAMVTPQKYTALFIVGNFADILRESDYGRVRDFIDARVETLLPGQKATLLSALDERCRQLGATRPNPELRERLETEFSAFRKKLNELIVQKRDMVLPDRIHRLTCGMTEAMKREMDAITAGLELDARQAQERSDALKEEQIQLSERQRKVRERMRGDIADMRDNAVMWIEDLLERMMRETETLSDISPADLKKFYSIYCVDTIQNAVERCRDYHMERIYGALEGMGGGHLSLGFSQSNYGFRFSLDNRTWTKGDNVSYVVSKIPQMGLLSLVLDGVAGSMRERETANQTPQLLETIRKQFPMFRVSAKEAVEDIYQKIAERVDGQLNDYFDERNQEEEAQGEQMVRVAVQSEEKKAEIRAVMEELSAAISRFPSV